MSEGMNLCLKVLYFSTFSVMLNAELESGTKRFMPGRIYRCALCSWKLLPLGRHEALCDGTGIRHKALHARENLQMRSLQLEITPLRGGMKRFVTELE